MDETKKVDAVTGEAKSTLEIEQKHKTTTLSHTETEDVIGVEVFKTTPAVVTLKKGRTINLKDFNSVRFDVGVSIPCYREQIDAAYELADTWTEERLTNVIDRFSEAWKKNNKKLPVADF